MERTIIIAEAGVNHNGDLSLAKKLVDEASISGADFVKFQTFKAENLVTQSAKKAEYQIKNMGSNETQFEMLKKLEISENDHLILIDYCQKKKIEFLSTPFDMESIDLLCKLKMHTFKVPSGEITNLPYLRKIGSLKKKVILSTGMSTLGEIETALSELEASGTSLKDIIVLHCSTDYPAVISEVNLRAMETIQKAFGIRIGYSDHTPGIEVSLAAVALGACLIEKHFTLDKTMEGPDHKASLNPQELRQLVSSIRNIELAMGSPVKKPGGSESKNLKIARKSIHAKKTIQAGEVFSAENLTVKRPGDGISPMMWDFLLGKKAHRNFQIDEKVDF